MRIDNEYATSNVYEMQELKRHGIRYTFVKTTDDGDTIWKYKKTSQLFETLKRLYGKG